MFVVVVVVVFVCLFVPSFLFCLFQCLFVCFVVVVVVVVVVMSRLLLAWQKKNVRRTFFKFYNCMQMSSLPISHTLVDDPYKQLTMALSQAPNLLRPNYLSGDLTDDCVNNFVFL